MSQLSLQDNSLLPKRGRSPYYIVVPRYVRTSAGIRSMHILCHWLNLRGQSAFVNIDPFWDGLQVNPDLTIPVLDQSIVDAHYDAGQVPVMVLPEVYDLTHSASVLKVRFLGNYPGHLGGPSRFPNEELLYGYSQHLANVTGFPDQVLHIPSINTHIFRPTKDLDVLRHGSCFLRR